MKILVVEDDENSRVLQHTLLESCGYSVTSAGNGREALKAMTDQLPDLILSDIMMPQMDGFAFCRAVKNNPATAHIPFVFYSATFTTEADRQLAEELGGDRFLVKPMEPDALLAALRGIAKGGKPVSHAVDHDAIDRKYADAISQKLEKKVGELKALQTALVMTQAQLERVEESHRLAERIARLGIWDWHLTDGAMWWSLELRAMLGLGEATVPALEGVMVRLDSGDRDRFGLALELAQSKGVPFHMDLQAEPVEGKTMCLHVEVDVASVDEGTGRPTRLVCVFQDVTRQRHVERERNRLELQLRHGQKMQALGTLAGSVAHDFKNILTIIAGNADYLKETGTFADEADRGYLDQILTACGRAKELAGQMIQFGRMEQLVKEPVNLTPIVEEVIQMVRPLLPCGVSMTSILLPDPPRIPAHPGQIHQVMINLCMNAIHALGEGPGQLEIAMKTLVVQAWDAVAAEGVRPGEYVVIRIHDSGCGMDEATRERIFEPYFTTKTPTEGNGLGLAVVHGVVLEHHGHVVVESQVGQGTTFSIYLPLEPATLPSPAT
ncbi:MAG TPA: response regulator [Kiritimatiellia bacterium]|nr:response regulator [Kiritimatiellia bacterium]